MLRKALCLSIVICFVLTVASPVGVSLADKGPKPPIPSSDMLKNLPVPDEKSVPDTVKQAVTLNQSLSSVQRDAVRRVLDKYLPALSAETQVATAGNLDAASIQPIDKDAVLRSQTVLKKIDAEMASILDAKQLAMYRAVMQADSFNRTVEKLVNPTLPAKPDAAVSPQGSYTSNCFNGAYYDAKSKYYANLALYYAYYNYYYYGTTYGYYSYLYAYYGYSDSKTALDYSGPTYMSYYYFGIYTSGYPYNAYYYSYYAQYELNYSLAYAYYDYSNTGHSWAYNAYYYAYYGYNAAYSAATYTYYCYYYS